MNSDASVSQKSGFQSFLEEEILKIKGIYHPVKAGFFRRHLTKKLPLRMLHPNPYDEFCDPGIGPNYSIISEYQNVFRAHMNDSQAGLYVDSPAFEPLQVQRIRPDGYLILNGHHRWAAAYLSGMKHINVEILDLTQQDNILDTLRVSKHDRRVTLDLDEVVFCPQGSPFCEKALPFLLRGRYKEHIRLGIPALFQYLTKRGYDIWVYSARYYSEDYLRLLFFHYHCPVTGFITGTSRKRPAGIIMRQELEDVFKARYLSTLHIDNDMILQTFAGSKEFGEYPLSFSDSRWSDEVMDIIQKIEAENQQKKRDSEKMRVSFDLDEVLFVSPQTHKTEPPLPFPLKNLYKERLRLGTPRLINKLQAMGYEVWVYTSSFRSQQYIRRLFSCYGVRFDGIVNGTRHLKEVQQNRKETLPQKLPNRYRISLHIDDEEIICSAASQYGFRAYQLNAQDDDWAQKIIDQAERIRRLEQFD